MVNTVSLKGYTWGHFGVIMYHIITGILIIYFTKFSKLTEKSRNLIILILCGALILISLLGLVPIFKSGWYDKKIIIE